MHIYMISKPHFRISMTEQEQTNLQGTNERGHSYSNGTESYRQETGNSPRSNDEMPTLTDSSSSMGSDLTESSDEESEDSDNSDATESAQLDRCWVEDGYNSDGAESGIKGRSLSISSHLDIKDPPILDSTYVRKAFKGEYSLRNRDEWQYMCEMKLAALGLTLTKKDWETLCTHKQECLTKLVEKLAWWEWNNQTERFLDFLYGTDVANCNICLQNRGLPRVMSFEPEYMETVQQN